MSQSASFLANRVNNFNFNKVIFKTMRVFFAIIFPLQWVGHLPPSDAELSNDRQMPGGMSRLGIDRYIQIRSENNSGWNSSTRLPSKTLSKIL